MSAISRNMKYMRIFAGVPGGVKRQCDCRRRQFFSDFGGYCGNGKH